MRYDSYTVEDYRDDKYGYYGCSHPVKIITWKFPEQEYDFSCMRCNTRYRVGEHYVTKRMRGLETVVYHRCPRCGYENKGYEHGISPYTVSYGDD